MRSIIGISFLLMAQFLLAQSSSIILSPIGPQTAYEDSRITVYFSTLKYFDNIDFTVNDLPEFGSLTYDQSGSGQIIFDTKEGDEGTYTINIDAQSGEFSNSISFDLTVLPIDEATSTIFYIDPATGSDNATGSESDPFATLSDFLATKISLVNDSTFIFLKSGFHGSPVFTGTRSNQVKVLAASGHTPRCKKLSFSFTTNWYISGFDISPENEAKVDADNLINVFAGSKFIEITNSKIYAIDDASVWTTNEMWYAGSGNGIVSSGTECLFRNNLLKNTWFTVEMRKAYNEFSYNIIDWFGADAIRAIASNQTVSYNQIKNATVYDYDHPTRPQHDDGIQSWTFNNPVKNIKIIGNQVADIANPNLPLPTEIMQGIVDFDGFAEDWEVTNNLVVTHHAHGIALYGAKNCNVSNNTVTRNPFNYYSPEFKPWIRINPRKVDVGGDLSFGNLVRNNIMSSYQDENLEAATTDNNVISLQYQNIFNDYSNWDFTLSETSPALNTGISASTPPIDQENKRRNVQEPDIGCFEKDATLTDREAPTSPSNVQFVTGQTEINIDWEESIDNTEVSHYEVLVNDNNTFTSNSNSIQVSRLEPGQNYNFELVAVDYFGNRSIPNITSAATSSEELMTVHYVPSHRHDQLIKSTIKLMWVGMPSFKIGDYDNGPDGVAVIPFQLPCLDSERTIVSADVLLHVEEVVGSPNGSLDLYLLELRAKSDVLATDYFEGEASSATSGIIIAENLVESGASGDVNLATEQQTALRTELIDLYNSGACNKFAFFRLNSNYVDEPNNSYYSISSSDNLNSYQRPLLKIISNSPSSIADLEVEHGLKIIPNPTMDKDIVISVSSDFESKPVLLEIHNSQGQKVYSKLIKSSENQIQIATDLNPGLYFATLLAKDKYAQSKFIKL